MKGLSSSTVACSVTVGSSYVLSEFCNCCSFVRKRIYWFLRTIGMLIISVLYKKETQRERDQQNKLRKVLNTVFSIKATECCLAACMRCWEERLLSVAGDVGGGVSATLSSAFCSQNIKGTWKLKALSPASCTESASLTYKTGPVYRDCCICLLHFSVVPPFLIILPRVPLRPRREGVLTTANTHIVLHQIWMGSLNAIVQDGDHNVLSRVTSLPGSFNIHVWLAGMCVVTAVLKEEEGKLDIADYQIVRRWENYLLVKIMH